MGGLYEFVFCGAVSEGSRRGRGWGGGGGKLKGEDVRFLLHGLIWLWTNELL